MAEVTAAATAPTAAILNGDASASKLAVGGAAGAGISGSCRRLMPTSAEHSVPQQSTRQTTTQPFPAPESCIPPGAPHHRSAPTRDPANHQPQHTASLRHFSSRLRTTTHVNTGYWLRVPGVCIRPAFWSSQAPLRRSPTATVLPPPRYLERCPSSDLLSAPAFWPKVQPIFFAGQFPTDDQLFRRFPGTLIPR